VVSWTENVRTAQVAVDVNTLENDIRNIIDERYYLIENCKNLQHKQVRYEQFCSDYRIVQHILEWLTGDRYEVYTKTHKQNPENLRDKIINYDEFVIEVEKLGFGHLL